MKKIIIWCLMMVLVISLVNPESFEPLDDRPVGYEFLLENGTITEKKSDATYLHIWNTNDDYFFNITSGIQFGNHFQEYWTTNIFCAGYKTDDWNYDCNDALPFAWSIESDNMTYINITGYRDKTIGSKEVRLALRYHLKTDDDNLTIIPYIKNIGTEDINVDVGFAWRVKNIKISNTFENDTIRLWNSSDVVYDEYNLSGTLNLTYTNLNVSKYEMWDNDYLMLAWNRNLNYKLMIDSQPSQYNAPVTLAINAGTLAVGITKYTKMFWIDAISVGDTGTTGVTAALSAGMTWNYEITCGDDMVLIVGIAVDSEPTANVTGITYNLDPMSEVYNVSSADNEESAEMWYLKNPDCGASYEVSVTFAGASAEEAAGGSQVYYGVDSVNLSTITIDRCDGCSASSIEVPAGKNDLVVDVIAVDIDTLTLGVGENQMERINYDAGVDAIGMSDGYATDGAVTMAWTWASDEMAHIGVALKPAVPAFSSPSLNETTVFQNTDLNHSITIGNNATHYIFSWNGSNDCTGGWVNTTILTMPTTSRVTIQNMSSVGNCAGKEIGWRFYANNTAGWGESDIEVYDVYSYGGLTVNLTLPPDDHSINQYETFDLNATITCVGTGAKCGLVEAYARYNKTVDGYNINTTNNASPMFVVGGEIPTINTTWDVVENEGDGVADGQGGFRVGDFTDDDYITAYAMFISNASLNISVISLNVGATAGDVSYASATVKICNYTAGSDICTVDVCTIVNNSWSPIDSIGWQNISITPYYIHPNINYSIKVETGGSDGGGDDDVIYIAQDDDGVDVTRTEWWDTALSCIPLATASANIILYDTVTPIPELLYPNPQTSPTTLSQGESWNVSWVVNATGATNTQYEVGVLFNSTTYPDNIPTNHTQNSTICIGTCPEEAPEDTCSPTSPLSADHTFDCSDNCIITSALDANGYIIYLTGAGSLIIDGVLITDYKGIDTGGTTNCGIICKNGGCFEGVGT